MDDINSVQAIKELIEKELSDSFSPELKKEIKKASLTLSAKIDSLQKTNCRIQKLNEEIEMLERNTLPKGCKPVPVSFETPFLDSDTSKTEATYTLTIPAGTTARKSKEIVHMFAQCAMRRIDVEIAGKQRDKLRLETRRSEFVDRCMVPHDTKAQQWQDLDLILEEDEVEIHGVNKVKLTAHLQVIYKKCIDQAAQTKLKQEHLATQQGKAKAALLEKLLAKTPEEHINMAIDKRVQEALKSQRGKGGKPHQQQEPVNYSGLFLASQLDPALGPEDIEKFVTTSKNGVTPSKGGGNGAKGKAKGKGKEQGSASDKGGKGGKNKYKRKENQQATAENNAKGKNGKGKGKSKNKRSASAKGAKGSGKGADSGGKKGGKDGKGKGKGKQRWTE